MTSVPDLPASHRFVVNYHVSPNVSSGSGPVELAPSPMVESRIFLKPTCTWGDVADEWFETQEWKGPLGFASAERCILTVDDKVVGWHLPLQSQVVPEALIIDVVARPIDEGTASYLQIGIPYRVSLLGLAWPAWQASDKCLINGLLLGRDYDSSVVDSSAIPAVSVSASKVVTRDQDNQLSNLVGLRFMDEGRVIWVNRHALVDSLNNYAEAEPVQMGKLHSQSTALGPFLARVSSALTARHIQPNQIDKTFPSLFDPAFRFKLPILAFERHLAVLDLRYSGALLT